MHSSVHSPARRALLLSALGAASAGLALRAGAQALPANRPIRLLVGAPPGGTTDVLARVVGDALSKSLGHPVIVDNKPGAGGAIVMDSLLSSPRDGLTYLVAVSSLVTELPYTFKPKYDPFKDIRPLADLGSGGLVLVGSTNLPPRNLQELVAYVKDRPGQVNFASYTTGTLSHVMGLQLNKLAGLDMNHVGYKGSPPALTDVIGGQVQFMFDGQATSIPMIKAGKLRAYAVSSARRSAALPDVPTLAEQGFASMTRAAWMGLYTLPGVPESIQQRIREETLKALAQPAIRARLDALGLGTDPQNPRTLEQMDRSLREDYEAVGEILRSVNYKPE